MAAALGLKRESARELARNHLLATMAQGEPRRGS
jgi:hypothetical protein